ncbi:TlpA disulfide reductase family protein [Undibacterium sp. RuRC25W]|uniref:TlpA disulfide reductase family protein n=1 Tax=Undibacterium sp. RuRC25W TaxID=3413047 RepID=UPI003BF33CE6
MLEPSSPRKFRLFAIIAAIALITLAVLFYQSLSGKTTIPDVTFTNLKGEKISAQSLRGKVVMVNFWATSCATCVAEMPKMVSTYNKYHADGLEYVAVAMSYDPANYVLNYVETRQLPFQVAIDADGQLAKAFGDVRMTPTTFVIDKQGNVLKRYLGEPSFDELHGLLEKALKA